MAQFSKRNYVQAVEQKCAECIYDPGCGGGTWREQVQACESRDCPLWGIRPLPLGVTHESDPTIPNVVKQRQQDWYNQDKWSN